MGVRTSLLAFAVAALGLAYVVAAHVQGIGIASADPDHPLVDCETFDARMWFRTACRPSMGARLDVLAVGAAVCVVLVGAAALVRVRH